MFRAYAIKYTGQLVEWHEVFSEDETLEERRSMVEDALQEIIEAYRDLGKPTLPGRCLQELITVET